MPLHPQKFSGFQSTLPVWGATVSFRHMSTVLYISIHAPRVGSDKIVRRRDIIPEDFNPRSPCGERLINSFQFFIINTFQSTLPVWGATVSYRSGAESVSISIHAPRVGSDFVAGKNHDKIIISIHAPRVGSDYDLGPQVFPHSPISIHAPRVGSDRRARREDRTCSNISIHAPRVGSDSRNIQRYS